ncbi:DUF2264 domain-containing protein [Larkinella terrae]|uniref:DUF2264 domain-containing protein n=1 Tax=Larkinella terrae TaxID=2025311 RepID=A0A7K0EM43_9BACT|nr:DUF2264 domain-containing protein [Larkinella terrae]MRS62920.1 DUF2264 domain-containing protein [Larkinella terrae]
MNFRVFTILLFSLIILQSVRAQKNAPGNSPTAEREYLVQTLVRIADPVLVSLSQNQLRAKMPIESSGTEREKYTHLEAFGRLLAGMAPWLELGPDETAEGKLRKKYIDLTLVALRNATDPKSPDFLNFNKGGQPVVDAAFFAQGLLRAPTQLWNRLDATSKANVIAALKSSRSVTPYYNNWLLFSAEVEAALLKFDGNYDRMRIDYALKSHQLWYKGDGTYGDGPSFHWDYYNSFVIQPMLLDVLKTLVDAVPNPSIKKEYETALSRAQRYAEVQESLISPEGTYPPLGRSLAYRFGAFQVLSQVALLKALPDGLEPQQVRAALYTLIKKQVEAPGTFDANGWLQIGLYGHQPQVGETYISTGSLYLCSEAFLMLGLPASDAFWTGPDKDWTSKRIWKGENIPVKHAKD